jgi:hypothetical protein
MQRIFNAICSNSTTVNHCIQLTADQRAFNIFSVSFCEVICNQRHQAAAADAGYATRQ